jgi:hypothetical protein
MMHHFRDPCIHCGAAQSDVAVGLCPGDPAKAIPIAYAIIETRWDGVEHYRIRFSDGRTEEVHAHVSSHLPYYHFGHSDELIQPPRYDQKLKDRAS